MTSPVSSLPNLVNIYSSTPVDELEDLLKLFVLDPSAITEEQRKKFYEYYPSLNEHRSGALHDGNRVIIWEHDKTDTMFTIACNIKDEKLIKDLIDACRRERCVDAIWISEINFSRSKYDFFKKLSEDLLFYWLEAIAEVNPSLFFDNDLVVHDYDSFKDTCGIIHYVIEYGSLAVLQKLVDVCGDRAKMLSIKNRFDKNALQFSAEKSKEEQFRWICNEHIRLGHTQELVCQSESGRTPLHYLQCCKEDTFTWFFNLLLEHVGPKAIRIVEKQGKSPFRYCHHFTKFYFDYFIKSGELDALEEPDEDGNPPLFTFPELLLPYFIQTDNSSALAAQNRKGETFLHYILREYGPEQREKYIEDYISYFKSKGKPEQILGANNIGESPLDSGSHFSPALLDFYSQFDPKMLTNTNSIGNTPLHYACDKNHIETIRAIMKIYKSEGMLSRIFQTNGNGFSPIRNLVNLTFGRRIKPNPLALSTILFEYFGTTNLLEISWRLYKNKELCKELFSIILYSESIEYAPGGIHTSSFGFFGKVFLQSSSLHHVQTSELVDRIADAKAPAFERMPNLPAFENLTEKVKILGRTLYVPTEKSTDFVDAYKFIKSEETEEKLALEYTLTNLFRSIYMTSTLPEPVGCYTVENIPEVMKDECKPFSDGKYRVYHYRAPNTYFRYLHEIESDEIFIQSVCKCLDDRVAQLLMGIHPVTADIWHTRRDERLYVPLSDLMAYSANGPNGMGRMQYGFANVLYPNERESGIADLADFELLSEAKKTRKKEFRYNLHEKKENEPLFQLNALSRLFFTYSLLAIYRRYKLGQINWQNEQFLQQLSEDLKFIFTEIFSLYTKEEASVKDFADLGNIDWTLMARQISFWVDSSKETGYYNWVYEGKLPPQIYPNTKATVQEGKAYENFNNDTSKVSGFWFDKNAEQFFRPGLGICEAGREGLQDFGFFNGPLGWVEFELAMYQFSIFALNIAEYKALQKSH